MRFRARPRFGARVRSGRRALQATATPRHCAKCRLEPLSWEQIAATHIAIADAGTTAHVHQVAFITWCEWMAASGWPRAASSRELVEIFAVGTAELEDLGFARWHRRVPTLLVPVWSVGGAIALRQHRPDVARMREGKAVKYGLPTTPEGWNAGLRNPLKRQLERNGRVPASWMPESANSGGDATGIAAEIRRAMARKKLRSSPRQHPRDDGQERR